MLMFIDLGIVVPDSSSSRQNSFLLVGFMLVGPGSVRLLCWTVGDATQRLLRKEIKTTGTLANVAAMSDSTGVNYAVKKNRMKRQ